MERTIHQLLKEVIDSGWSVSIERVFRGPPYVEVKRACGSEERFVRRSLPRRSIGVDDWTDIRNFFLDALDKYALCEVVGHEPIEIYYTTWQCTMCNFVFRRLDESAFNA